MKDLESIAIGCLKSTDVEDRTIYLYNNKLNKTDLITIINIICEAIKEVDKQ